MNQRAMSPIFRKITSLLLPLALLACNAEPTPPAEQPPLAGAAIGGPFTLMDKDGNTVRWNDFDGSYRTVYFGFTFCPDACPTDMQVLAAAFSKFEKSHPALAAKVQPIFISVDPERDGPKEVGLFAAHFHPRLIGLTGTREQVNEAAKNFAAYHAKGNETAGGYLVDHSRVVYLMAPDGKPITMLPVDKGPDAVVTELEKWVH